MPDCTHDQLRHDVFHANPKNAESPIFNTVRCTKCGQLVGVFPIDRNMGFLQTITREVGELTKAVYRVESAITKK
jgi:hypothetical protein